MILNVERKHAAEQEAETLDIARDLGLLQARLKGVQSAVNLALVEVGLLRNAAYEVAGYSKKHDGSYGPKEEGDRA